MTVETLIEALGRTGPLPPAELDSLLGRALAGAEALAPHLKALCDKAAEGVYLLPHQEQLLHVGLHVAAAAGRTELAPALRRLLASDPVIVEQVLGDESIAIGASLMASLHDGEDRALLDVAADPALDGEARWIAFLALARLVRDGRIERAPVVDLLERMDAERAAPDGDFAWQGWQDAVVYLGVAELAPALEAVWDDGRLVPLHEEERAELRRRLAWSADHPDDGSLMAADQVAPITDLQASLAWLASTPEGHERGRKGPRDPALGIALDEAERRWLQGFLASPQAPGATFTLEMVDGFFSALVAGPVLVLPSEYMPVVWGAEGEGPTFDSLEQAEYVTQLLMRHWNTIAKRLDSGTPHAPILFPATLDQAARSWARGFLVGMDLRRELWRPMFDAEDEEAATPVEFIMGLIRDEMGEEAIHEEDRAHIVRHLPTVLASVAAFWRRPKRPAKRPAKIGRNEPCPCGSGKKYKKCCGAG